jgi:TPR repeat protein
VSRAAAAGIITIALGAILGVLAFNFRQDIGSLMIQLGQIISGQDHSAVPSAAAPSPPAPETKSESKPADQPTSTDKQPPAISSREPAGDSASEANSLPTPSSPKTSVALRDSSVAGKSGTPGASALGPSQSPSSTPVSSPAIPADGGTGQEEFSAAREILRGSNRQRDFSRAVDLLWAGVRKGYVPAEVTLADLFRRGDGVEKNCDQARVLLVAASKKGSADARQMLEQIAEQGCQ